MTAAERNIGYKHMTDIPNSRRSPMEHERDMPDAQTDAPTLQDRLRGKPLYAQCGEESNLPDDAADALDAAQAEIAKLRVALEEATAMADSCETYFESECDMTFVL